MNRPQPMPRASLAVTAALVVAVASLPRPGLAADGARWHPRLSAGHDLYVHTYALARDDTTETISESTVTAGVRGRSDRDARHRWSLRGEFSAGTELLREVLDATYRWRPAGQDRLRADLAWYGRQYRGGSEYGLSSDNHEGRAGLRTFPWTGSSLGLEVRGGVRWLDHATPSSLEQDWLEARGAVFASSRGDLDGAWRLGLRLASRSYPDTTALDRDTMALEGSWEHAPLDGPDVWLFHRTERREVADPAARPGAWSHWTEGRAAVGAGAGEAVVELTSEVWRYEREDLTYVNSWRLDTGLGYRRGDLLTAQWQGLLAVEHLAAGDAPETYTQVGLRASVESYAEPFSGVVALELGRRWYADPARGGDDTDLLDLLDGADTLLRSSDFDYLEVWIMARWTLSAALALEVTASYLPERHTEQDDDVALGFGSAHLVWRP